MQISYNTDNNNHHNEYEIAWMPLWTLLVRSIPSPIVNYLLCKSIAIPNQWCMRYFSHWLWSAIEKGHQPFGQYSVTVSSPIKQMRSTQCTDLISFHFSFNSIQFAFKREFDLAVDFSMNWIWRISSNAWRRHRLIYQPSLKWSSVGGKGGGMMGDK